MEPQVSGLVLLRQALEGPISKEGFATSAAHSSLSLLQSSVETAGLGECRDCRVAGGNCGMERC